MSVPWDLPVMQAPIGPAGTPELVIAVSNLGGLGTLAASWTEPAELRETLRRISSETKKPFCVNLVLAFDQRRRLAVALEEGVRVFSFSWGIDGELIARARAAGATVLVQAGDLEAGVEAARAGADIIVAQGLEAGGHVEGTMPLLQLVRELRATVDLPIVAAGGIADRSTVEAAISAGADAVAAGTAYLAASEADVHPAYLEALLGADASDTALTTLFDVGWPDAPHRVVRNDTLTRWETAGRPATGARPGEGETIATRDRKPIVRYSDAQPTKQTEGAIEAMAMYAGTSAAAVTRTASAAAITTRLAHTIP
jgi:nitronate monooxygenase